MNTVGFVKTIRHLIADDTELQTIFNLNAEDFINRVYYQDSGLTNISGQGDSSYSYPCISVLPNNEGSFPLGIPTNTVKLYIILHNSIKNDNAIEVLLNAEDRLRLLFRDKHESINIKSRSLLPALNLKVRDSQWVSGVNYQDKELGSERLHKLISTLILIIGD